MSLTPIQDLRSAPQTARYAIYWLPPPGMVLNRLGSAWLGRDLDKDEDVELPVVAGCSTQQLEAWRAEPRRYGLHATLKAPFYLAADRTPSALVDAVASLAGSVPRTVSPPLQLARWDGFFALAPSRQPPELFALAAASVRRLDHFRVPLHDADLRRRKTSRLTAEQTANLDQWGYPYVMEEFRFHVTLARVPETEAEAARTAISQFFAPVIGTTVEIADVALLMQSTATTPFRLVRRFPLGVP